MIRGSLITPVIFALLLGFPAGADQIGALRARNGDLQPTTDSKYRLGEVWEYTTRSGEEQSRLTVVRIDKSSKLGIIIHVAVDRLTWRTCHGDSLDEQIPHMPFAREPIEHSVNRRVGSSHSLPNYQEGYEEWKNAFLNGHAGIYTISVKDAVLAAETTWRTGMGCKANP